MPRITDYRQFKPRNDFCLIEIVDLDKLNGIVIPQISNQAKEHRVVAVGPAVEGLKVGDIVRAVGQMGQDVVTLPDFTNVYVTKQANVILVMGNALE